MILDFACLKSRTNKHRRHHAPPLFLLLLLAHGSWLKWTLLRRVETLLLRQRVLLPAPSIRRPQKHNSETRQNCGFNKGSGDHEKIKDFMGMESNHLTRGGQGSCLAHYKLRLGRFSPSNLVFVWHPIVPGSCGASFVKIDKKARKKGLICA